MVLSINVFAQKEAKMKADKAYDQLSYLKAADLYQQLGEGKLDAVAKARLADSYRLNGDTESAEYWYAQSAKETGQPKDILHYAQVLQSNGKCEAALQWYNKYRGLMGNDYPLPRAGITDCNKVSFLPKERVYVNHIPALNSGHLDYSPVPYKDGVVFTSTRGKAGSAIEDQWTKDNFSDLFFASKLGAESFGAVQLLEGDINGKFHDGAATFNKAGTKMYFSRNNDQGKNSKSIIDLKIYSADLQGQKWVNITELSFNNKEYATCHPTLSEDGNTLYFASNRPGGLGGMDIYRAVRMGDTWTTPENLGKEVNTAGNEIFPFVDKNGVVYFASNGWPGVGGLDVYQTSYKNEGWTVAENMGEPINSIKDDFGYAVLGNEEEGYFTSNRNGGIGEDDIYHWTTTLTGETPENIIAVIDEHSGERVKDAMVTIVEGVRSNMTSSPAGAGKKVSGNGTGINPTEFEVQPISFLTDFKGKIQPDVKSGKTYTILVEKAGYATVTKIVTASDLMRTPEWIVPINKRKGLPLHGTIINEKYNHFVPNAKVELFNLCTGEYEKIETDDKGNFEFFLDCNCDYELVGKKERFSQDKKKYSTTGMDCQTSKPIKSILYLKAEETVVKPAVRTVPSPPVVNVKPTTTPVIVETESNLPTYKVGQVIELDNVYYDFNKATIRGDASDELDRVVSILNQYPSMEIQLLSHTDSRGDLIYNENLSQRRAESAVGYIVSRGIDRNRLTGKGYGEWLLKNDCKDGVNCNDAQHQENRRTEIKIVKLDADVEVKYRR